MNAELEREMTEWASQHGSERLRIGMEDGYWMVPVYLQERARHEAGSGFYAWRVDGEKKPWQERKAPTGDALTLRRQVQARVAAATPDDQPIPEAQIVWLNDPPERMCDLHLWEGGECEAIIVPGWLGRYTLVGVVRTAQCPALHIADEYTVGAPA